ncbi:MAG: hydroxyacylglutathione hydrolase [Aphanocapsa sp. GSE-SYN-MK-11-07L]|jgi:hydroxyacylglutathione hydrolase|nr:hydroxyacylglutathione hydrolase [Aphanocapsa sp. GSE-SYN-MK-11-07L]
MEIHLLPAFTDNYFFVLHDPQRQSAAVIDPGAAQPVLACLASLSANLEAILITHHHHDHVGGISQLLKEFPQAIVYGGAADRGRIPGQQVYLQEGDRVTFGDRTAEVLFVPGHTLGHIAYYFPATEHKLGELFCGDTLFAGGCGRLKEGSPAQMVASLSKIRDLPAPTRVWCAHEYTLKNLLFAQTVDRDNADLEVRLAEVKQIRQQGRPTIPTAIALEKLTNPFLRWDNPKLQQAVNAHDSIQTFARLRGMKDQF